MQFNFDLVVNSFPLLLVGAGVTIKIPACRPVRRGHRLLRHQLGCLRGGDLPRRHSVD